MQRNDLPFSQKDLQRFSAPVFNKYEKKKGTEIYEKELLPQPLKKNKGKEKEEKKKSTITLEEVSPLDKIQNLLSVLYGDDKQDKFTENDKKSRDELNQALIKAIEYKSRIEKSEFADNFEIPLENKHDYEPAEQGKQTHKNTQKTIYLDKQALYEELVYYIQYEANHILAFDSNDIRNLLLEAVDALEEASKEMAVRAAIIDFYQEKTALEKEAEKLTLEKKTLLTELEKVRGEVEHLKIQFQNKKNREDAARTSLMLESVNEDTVSLRIELAVAEAVEKAVREKEEEIKKAQTENQELTEKNDEQSKEIERLQKLVTQETEQKELISLEKARLEKSSKKSVEDILELQETISKYENTIRILEKELASKQEEISAQTEHQEKLAEEHRKIQEQKESLKAQEEMLVAKDEEQKNTARQLVDEKELNTQLGGELAQVKLIMTEQASLLEKNELMIKRLQETVQQLEGQKRKLENVNRRLQAKLRPAPIADSSPAKTNTSEKDIKEKEVENEESKEQLVKKINDLKYDIKQLEERNKFLEDRHIKQDEELSLFSEAYNTLTNLFGKVFKDLFYEIITHSTLKVEQGTLRNQAIILKKECENSSTPEEKERKTQEISKIREDLTLTNEKELASFKLVNQKALEVEENIYKNYNNNPVVKANIDERRRLRNEQILRNKQMKSKSKHKDSSHETPLEAKVVIAQSPTTTSPVTVPHASPLGNSIASNPSNFWSGLGNNLSNLTAGVATMVNKNTHKNNLI